MSKTTKALAALGVVAGLGVAALPLSSYAANNDDMTVKLAVKDFISLETTQTKKTVDLGNVINNGPIVSGTGTINVKTNNAKGYYVQIAPKEASNVDMVSGSDKIPAGLPAQNTSAWGYALAPEEGEATYKKLEAAGAVLTTGATATENAGDTITIQFGASVDAKQPAGDYSTVVTFTATTDATAAPAA